MKNSIIYLGIALVVFISVSNVAFETKNEVKASKVKSIKNNANEQLVSLSSAKKIFKQELKAKQVLDLDGIITGNFIITPVNAIYEATESISTCKTEKTTDQLIAEDNAITENTISNKREALDFDIINGNSTIDEVIEIANPNKIEKTADQIIAEDNAITENNISNKTEALDFEIINNSSILILGTNKPLFAID